MIDRSLLAGGPFAYAGDQPHGCLNGYVYIGHVVLDDAGDEVEVLEAVPCKRCAIAQYEAHQAMEAPGSEAFLPFHEPAPGVRSEVDDAGDEGDRP